MCHGGVADELIQLNDDTFWSGAPSDWDVPLAGDAVEAARRLLREGRHGDAEAALRQAQGPYVQSYQPLGDLTLRFDHGDGPVSSYRRLLQLDSGLVEVQYELEGVAYERHAFVAAGAGVLVLRLRCSRPGGLGLAVGLDAALPHEVRPADFHGLTMTLKAPAHVTASHIDSPTAIVHDDRLGHGMYAAVALRVSTDGAVHHSGSGVRIEDATRATIVLASKTGFRGYDAAPSGTRAQCLHAAIARVDRAWVVDDERLMREHVAEHRRWFERVELALQPAADPSTLTTRELIEQAATSPEAATALAVLLFQYGRYLLIASSRPGTQAANLQGIWNRHVRPPWSSNYTININTQMNYWPAEPAGLPELHQPLLDLVAELAVTGTRTASHGYGLPGWLAHHNTDVWRHSMAVGAGEGAAKWANWWMGGAWLAHHLLERYAFSQDLEDLRRVYPVLRGAAEFLLGWLVQDEGGEWVTCPSTSPENQFRSATGDAAAVTMAATMDLALAAQVFDDVVASATALGIDDAVAARAAAVRAGLRAPGVGSRGQLLEWATELEEVEPHHRHVSHLVGIFPGDVHADDLALRDAARVTLDERGDASTGWSRAWKANLWARLGDGERAFALVRGFCTVVTTDEVTQDGGVYANLLCAHPPFQIDGNFGITSAVMLMLLDSRLDRLDLLPALPSAWPAGHVRGLRARGGFTVDLAWSSGRLDAATVLASVDGECRVRYGETEVRIPTRAGRTYSLDGRLESRIP